MKIERKFFQTVVIVIFVGSRGYARPFDRMWVGNTLGHSEARACYVTPCLGFLAWARAMQVRGADKALYQHAQWTSSLGHHPLAWAEKGT